MCKHIFVHFPSVKVCTACGTAERVLCLDTFNLNSAPLYRGYNRRSRFSLKVRKLLGLHGGPSYEDPVWKYLNSQRVTLNSPFDVRASLRTSSLKNKHYDSIRNFCDVFTDLRTVSDPEPIKRRLFFKFDRMYAKWNASSETKFFSYAWILRRFLNEINSPLVCYLKPPTCRRRDAKYTALLNNIQTTS